MTSAESALIDANVLVYAIDAESPHHRPSRALLTAAHGESAVTLYVTPQVLCEFYSVVTNPRRVRNPILPSEAVAAISGLLARVHVLPVPPTVADELLALLRRRPVTGGEVFDLQIVATMKANRISRIYTFNTGDFSAFSEIEAIAPA